MCLVPPGDRDVSESIKATQSLLPITAYRRQILQAVRDKDVIVLEAATGSGKSTQVPQYLLSEGYRVAVTQPRRVAAISVAQRVAEETGTVLGQTVGYQVRFEDCSTANKTRVKFMTDGMLLREAISDPSFSRYDVVIVDEVHERSLHTDFLLGLLHRLLLSTNQTNTNKKRVKVILMSATLNSHKLLSFFDPCGEHSAVVAVPGRSFPVQIVYTEKPQLDYLEAAASTVQAIVEDYAGMLVPEIGERADILVFLPGQEEILTLKQMLQEGEYLQGQDICVLPIYSSLSKEEQMRIFENPENPSTRKIILATNIAESSITVPGVRFCVDTGLVKISVQTGSFSQLTPVPASQQSLTQRAGRAGRDSAGFCFRLFTHAAFQTLARETQPEITRTDLAHVVLQFLAITNKHGNSISFVDFPLIDRPCPSLVRTAERLLQRLGAVEGGRLTPKGERLASLPLHPLLGNLLEQNSGCMSELLTLVALLSSDVQLPRVGNFNWPAGFDRKLGDHVHLVQLFRKFKRGADYQSGLKFPCFGKTGQVREQLKKLYRQVFPERTTIDSCGDDLDILRRAICGGLWVNVARRRDDGSGAIGEYETMNKTVCFIHPSSAVFAIRPHPPVVVYTELQKTRKIYMRAVTPVEPEWLHELMPGKFRLVE